MKHTMKKEDEISFGEELTYRWKYITIDPIAGIPIFLNRREIGGFLVTPSMLPGNIKMLSMEGIELDPEYRRLGIGTEVVNMLIEQCDIILGSVTEDEPKPFWTRMNAEFRDIPRKAFPDNQQASIHTDTPQVFFITENGNAKYYAEQFAKALPALLRGIRVDFTS